ncbi:UDP-glucose 4-epimerase [Fontibacillus panacisegetis]|uniref:UDP-glucose 4-epimerase n=1 Tax=Fontibacillus panacisegetis TaxID=670482 RepID=A0A1G7JTT5_9BACL|nr:NAD-dependent epimerase/dehydratase family protein [Fontibacillus panacisegetis]SDF28377.1 UDP-glucose 4-epimerase [Fontibacillus panacisegetis]
MKVIVTGGAGFIGSHLVEALVQQGAEVQVIDNLSTGNESYLPEGVPLYLLDIRSEEAGERIVFEQPDIVFHQAAQVDVQCSVKEPGYDAGVNIAGSANIMQACVRASVRKIIYASSCAVYGDLDSPLIDEQDPIKPLSFYGLSKLTPESYLRIFHELYGLEYTVLRYANVYGPRQTPKGEGGVVSIFMDRIRKGLPLVIFGDGEQTRDFIYVKDVVEGNLAAITRGNGQIIQLGTAISTSINDLMLKLRNIHGQNLVSTYQQERSGDIKHSCLNNVRALQDLKWQPKYDLNRGLQDTYDYEINKD